MIGLVAVVGCAYRPLQSRPTNHVLPAWDITRPPRGAGGLDAERVGQTSGEGAFITISLADIAIAMVANLGYLAQAQVSSDHRVSTGKDLNGAFGRDFPTSDGVIDSCL